jgi:prolyl oligopeptidase
MPKGLPDPFVSLESRTPETLAWERREEDATVNALHSHARFDEVHAHMKSYRAAREPRRAISSNGANLWSLEQIPGGNVMAVVLVDSAKHRSVLFQVTAEDAAAGQRIDFMSVSPSGRWIAIGISKGGVEETTVRVIDAHTGADHGDRTEDVSLEALSWFPDDAGYLYTRGRGLGTPAQDKYRDLSIALHRLGSPSDRDVEVVGSRAPGKAMLREFDLCYGDISPDGKYVVLTVRHGITPDRALSAKRFDELLDFRAEWAPLYSENDRVNAFALDRDRLLVLRGRGEGGSALEERSLSTGQTRGLYESAKPLARVFSTGSDVYVVETDVAMMHLLRIGPTGVPSPVPLPSSGSVHPDSVDADRVSGHLTLQLRSWSEPPSWWSLSRGGAQATPLPSPGPGLPSQASFDVTSEEIPVRDGTLVPVTIVRPAGTKGPPKYVWAMAYGAYGVVLGPTFFAPRREFLERGGTFVAVHVRGGGEKGRAWHDQARGATKVRTVEDLIDVLKSLRASGFGDGGGILLFGASAGGIPVGGLLVRAPELVDGVIIDSGITNATRIEGGSSSIAGAEKEEFGTVADPESARHVAEIDAYLNVRDGVAYPATMAVGATNDVRVPYWQATKLVARLQQATTGTAPIYLRLIGGGLVTGTTADEGNALAAETAIFALSHVHQPDFQ